MGQFIFINKIQVQDASCVAGLTWGFPSITGFSGFTHALSLKVQQSSFSKIKVCQQVMVVAHEHHHHTYENDYQITRFSQKRGANFYSNTESGKRSKTMTRIEEGRMDMIISLLIPIKGRVGSNIKGSFVDYLIHTVSTMRIAGGSVTSIKEIDVLALDDLNPGNQLLVKRKLMPGYVLLDATSDFIKHTNNVNPLVVDQVEAWLNFSNIKYKARPEHGKLTNYFNELNKSEDTKVKDIVKVWLEHIDKSYDQSDIQNELVQHFFEMSDSISEELLMQWQEYVNPNDQTPANWEIVEKPAPGYLVPIMNGYKRISEDVSDLGNLRGVKSTPEHQGDFESAYFAEATYSIAKWVFVRRINFENLNQFFWQNKYDPEVGLYSCVMSNGV